MGNCAPETFDWAAVEDRQPPGVRLRVSGKVVTTNGALRPRLTKAVPQGTNPTILILDLTIEDTGTGTTDVSPRPAEYREDVSPGQYTSVEIRWEGNSLHRIDHIEVVH